MVMARTRQFAPNKRAPSVRKLNLWLQFLWLYSEIALALPELETELFGGYLDVW